MYVSVADGVWVLMCARRWPLGRGSKGQSVPLGHRASWRNPTWDCFTGQVAPCSLADHMSGRVRWDGIGFGGTDSERRQVDRLVNRGGSSVVDSNDPVHGH